MNKIIKNWINYSLRISSILFFLILSFIIFSNFFLVFLNAKLLLILVIILVMLFFSFILFGKIFIIKLINNVNKIDEIIKIISKDIFNDYDYDYFKSNDEDEIDNILSKVSEIAFKIKSSEHSKNDFISIMSHELRTPLTAIKGWAETMKTGDVIDFSTLRRGLDVIIKETERLTSIVEELIDFSVLESGRLKLNMEKIDILAEISEAVFIFKERIARENKKLIYNEPEFVVNIMGDKNRLRQVFLNVIDNAVKYTEEGGFIKIDLKKSEDEIIIKIEDNGCGISQNDLPKVKQKFYKANFSHKGSGIGLAIANEIINLHKGKIEIESTEDKGTIVTILIHSIVDNLI